MATTKITKRLLDSDNLPDRYYHDTELPGFGAYIGKNRITFFIQYRTGYGRESEKKRMTIGRFGPMTLAQARKLAKEKLGRAALGHDPSKERQDEAKKITMTAIWDEYKKARPDLKGIVTDQNRFDKHIKPYCGHKKPDELAPIDIDRLRVKLLKTHKPGTVRNILELLRRIVNFADSRNLCPVPDFNIKLPKVDNKKTEDLTADQLSALWEAIAKDSNIQAANFMRMVLFTGMRRGELFRLQWEHIDFDRGFIKLVDTKGGQTERIPLNDAARALLHEHPRTDDSLYVFPGRNGGQRIDINKQVGRIKNRAGLPKGFRALHGLRHVYASTLASSGKVDMYTLQRLLTHKSPAMTQRYAHLRDETLQRAAQLAGDLMTERSEAKHKKRREVA